MILDKIVEKKLIRLKEKKAQLSLDEIKLQAQKIEVERRSFKGALTASNDIAIIGEIKNASPSKGIIKGNFDPIKLAKAYNNSDVQAMSVLTEEDFFLGHHEYMICAHKNSSLPVLRKDFIIDEWQIYESYILGADAILLIVTILNDKQLKKYLKLAKELNLDTLVEVHDKKELLRALIADAEIIGINNRNLNDFSVDLATTENLIKYIPDNKVIVGESGIHTNEDLIRLKNAGVNALLIGESLMRAESISKAVDKLRGIK